MLLCVFLFLKTRGVFFPMLFWLCLGGGGEVGSGTKNGNLETLFPMLFCFCFSWCLEKLEAVVPCCFGFCYFGVLKKNSRRFFHVDLAVFGGVGGGWFGYQKRKSRDSFSHVVLFLLFLVFGKTRGPGRWFAH